MTVARISVVDLFLGESLRKIENAGISVEVAPIGVGNNRLFADSETQQTASRAHQLPSGDAGIAPPVDGKSLQQLVSLHKFSSLHNLAALASGDDPVETLATSLASLSKPAAGLVRTGDPLGLQRFLAFLQSSALSDIAGKNTATVQHWALNMTASPVEMHSSLKILIERVVGHGGRSASDGVADVGRQSGASANPVSLNATLNAVHLAPNAMASAGEEADVGPRLADLMTSVMSVEAGQRGMLAGVIFNAAMIPGWPPQAPYVSLQSGRASAVLSEMAKMSDEEMIAYLANLGIGRQLLKRLKRWLNRKGEDSGKKILALLTLMTLVVADVFEAVRNEARRALEDLEEFVEFEESEDGDGVAGSKMRKGRRRPKVRSKVILK